jgi:hypothetical protein
VSEAPALSPELQENEPMAATKKRKKKKSPEPHCKNINRKDGKKQKMCWGKDGKITSAANVAAYRKRRATQRARQAA